MTSLAVAATQTAGREEARAPRPVAKMAAKLAKWAALPTAVTCASINVYAATDEKPKSHRLKAHQLPIYDAPPLDSRYIDEKPGRLQTGISSVRKTTGYYVSGCKDAYLSVKSGVGSSIQFGKDAYVYLKNPPPEFLPKVGVITISGLTGLVLARKGSRFKKIVYPLGLGTLGISLCYPAQSVIITKVTGGKIYAVSHKIYEAIGSLWSKKSTAEVLPAQTKAAQRRARRKQDGEGKQRRSWKNASNKEVVVQASETRHSLSEVHKAALVSEEKTKVPEKQFHAEKATLDQTDSVPSVRSDLLKTPKFKPDPSLMDHGQSNPEDADMYSSRS
uniref:MICOS complex subunit n=1 Tax=Salvator merianae TaxID=96440 RepID=A0A8D0BNM3_SALMN